MRKTPKKTADFKVGEVVRAYDPRALAVIRTGEIWFVGRNYLHVHFGSAGSAQILPVEVIERVR